MARQDVMEFLGADPRRPWPGIARDDVAASTGIAEMSLGRTVVQLGRDPDSWPAADHRADVVFAPLAFVTASENPAECADLLRSYIRVGGLCVTEEPAPPIGDSSFVEPVAIEVDHVVLAAVHVTSGTYHVRLARFGSDGHSVTVAQLSPMTPRQVDDAMDARFAPIGRWTTWQGRPATGAPWHIALHRGTGASP